MGIRQQIVLAISGLIILAAGGVVIRTQHHGPAPEPQLTANTEIASSSSTIIEPAPEIAISTTTPSSTPAALSVSPSSTKPVAATSSLQKVASSSTPPQAQASSSVKSGATRDRINAPLGDQNKLLNSTVAIVCVSPLKYRDDSTFYSGTGVIINSSGYILTNAHVLGDSTNCYVGRKRPVPVGYQARAPLPTIALYYSLELVGKGIQDIPNATEEDWGKTTHDFAIFKIGEKLPRKYYRSVDAPAELQTLNNTFILWATDEEYAAFPKTGPFPAITLNLDYQPVVGDWLSLGGYIGSNTNPDYVFAAGRIIKIDPKEIVVEMPTGQGLSGSAVVDNNGKMVALTHATDCTLSGGCTASVGFDVVYYVYGNNSLAITLPALDKAMKADVGFGLRELQAMQ